MSEQINGIIQENDLETVNGGVSGIMVIPYVVQKGDTLNSLAKKFNTTVTQIKKDNARVLKGSTKLTPGMLLNIAKNSKK
ncbi:MAG: LysM peptidoglycan-binding domain-containing protein [Lachnospiraceae bacterium]|nr:LysM peptidoglycan-binding domain-containing protein [Lachnospiraceae bacterium]